MSNQNLKPEPKTPAPAEPSAQAAEAAAAAGAPEAPATENGAEETQLQADMERFRDLAMRTQADFENYRKRAIREKEEAVKYANAALIERLIPLLDNFELGLQAARAEGSQGVIVGFEMVAKQFQEFLASCGVEAVEAEGKPFDPNFHEAVGHEASDTVAEGIVIRQLRKGYKLRDRLIRAANVFVSKGKA
ncbi:MAG: nucleotide exchange factor GrpE [Chthoniobacteraceae bacterium]|nr:nucleotide exchange factor GrpE [Chthoniobacteraceae bacterium]